MSENLEIRYTSEVIYARLPDGSKAWLLYKIVNEKMYLYKTYTPPQHRGKGIARKLVEKAIDIARERGLRIVPVCSYTIRFFMKNPDKRNVLVEELAKLSDEEWQKLLEERLRKEASSRAS